MEQTRSLLKSLAVKESGAIGVRRYSEYRLTKKAKCGACPPHENISVFVFGLADTAHLLKYAKIINQLFCDAWVYRQPEAPILSGLSSFKGDFVIKLKERDLWKQK